MLLDFFNTWIAPSLYALAMYMGIDKEFLGIFFWLLGTDMFVGVVRVGFAKETFHFSVLLGGAIAKGMMLIVPTLLASAGKASDMDFTPYTEIVLGILCVQMGVSIIQNLECIYSKRGGEVKSDLVTKMLHLLTSVITTGSDILLNKIKNFKLK